MAPSNFGPAPKPPAPSSPSEIGFTEADPEEEMDMAPPEDPEILVSMADALESLRKTRVDARIHAKKSQAAFDCAKAAAESSAFLKTNRFPRAASG